MDRRSPPDAPAPPPAPASGPDGEEIARLFRRIEAEREALVALTRDLIRFPTVNPPGDAYEACARFLGARLAGTGATVRYVRGHGEPDDSDLHPRVNVIGRWESGRPGPVIHFNGHIDVVEAGLGWTLPPFAGEVRDGRVYGRGACDMKGGIAAALIAVEALLAEGLLSQGALEFSGTVDEESGGFGGVGHLARNGWFDRGRVDHVIIPEPLNPDRVCLGHRGVYWAEVEIRGRIGHGAMPFLGVSAIAGMGDFLALIERELLPALRARRTRMPCVPDGARAATLNLNSIHGGQPDPHGGRPAPVVADRCRLVLDRRYLIEEDPDAVTGEIVALLERVKAGRAGIDYSLREIMRFEPTMTEPEAPLVRALDHWIEALFGRPAAHVASPGTYDQKHVARFGQVRDCVAYGPGILDLAHQPDEWVGIDDMVTSAKVMAATTLTLLRRATPAA
ncbi:MAG: acetylornithine deacetylase/succinyl-diaminopimelate desuccinylase family protein [Hyphomicrobiales bacterium]|nr:acetylornithine deacetylase/succinyl-diaminopimelate desuccinylase family protein [Hyphomicrobiales bacterium]MCA1999655.1 acetylornithine deacetylase/succinyl-diaminopimelate desuccinylase family protein [Hyphomicrobiales bacterium]